MRTSKKKRAFPYFLFLILCALIAPGSLRASVVSVQETSVKADCVAFKFKTPRGSWVTRYAKRDKKYARFDEENEREQLYSDDNCETEASTHLYRKYVHRGGTRVPVVHLHEPSGPNKYMGPLDGLEWKEEDIPYTPPAREEEDQQEAGDGPPRTGNGTVEMPDVGNAGPVVPPNRDEAATNTLITFISRILIETHKYDNDIVDQLGRFVWEKKHAFVTDKKRDGKEDVAPDLKGYVAIWVGGILTPAMREEARKALAQGQMPKVDVAAAQIAAMYFIVSKPATGMLADYPRLAAFEGKRKGYYATLLKCLALYAGKKTTGLKTEDQAAVCHPYGKVRSPAPLDTGVAAAEWSKEFFTTASISSMKIIAASRFTKPELDAISDRNDQNDGAVGGGDGGGAGNFPELPVNSTALDTAHLFGAFGDKNVFELDGRMLAIVPRLTRTFQNGKSVWTQKVGVYDITSPGEIYGTHFDLGAKKTNFKFKGGGRSYVIDIQPQAGGFDHSISIKRPNGKEPYFGHDGMKMPTMNELFQIRAEKALASGLVSKVGEGDNAKTYRVTGESAKEAYYLYWSQETLQKIKNGEISGRNIVPDAVAMAVKVQNNRIVPVAATVQTGLTDKAGKYYDLAYGPDGVWKPIPGKMPADTPPPAKAETSAQGEGTQGGNQTQGGAGSTTTPPAQGSAWPGYNINGVALSYDAQPVADINSQLAAKGFKVGVVPGKVAGELQFFFVGKTEGVSEIRLGEKGKNVSFNLNGNVLEASDGKGTVFIDAVKGFDTSITSELVLRELARHSKKGDASIVEGKDLSLFIKALSVGGFTDAEQGEIRKNAETALKKTQEAQGSISDFKLEGSNANNSRTARITIGSKHWELWPFMSREAKDSQSSDRAGHGVYVDPKQGGLGLSDFQNFNLPEIAIDGRKAYVSTAKTAADGMAILIKAESWENGDVPRGAKTEWHLRFQVRNKNGQTSVSSPHKVFENNNTGTSPRTMLPPDVAILGIDLAKVSPSLKIPDDWSRQNGNAHWELRVVETPHANLTKQGVLAVFDTSVDAGKYDSFIAVVGYWGAITLKDAESFAQIPGR